MKVLLCFIIILMHVFEVILTMNGYSGLVQWSLLINVVLTNKYLMHYTIIKILKRLSFFNKNNKVFFNNIHINLYVYLL